MADPAGENQNQGFHTSQKSFEYRKPMKSMILRPEKIKLTLKNSNLADYLEINFFFVFQQDFRSILKFKKRSENKLNIQDHRVFLVLALFFDRKTLFTNVFLYPKVIWLVKKPVFDFRPLFFGFSILCITVSSLIVVLAVRVGIVCNVA